MRVWIDIDNPPQVQYLSPFERAFAELGAGVVVTARDYGDALELLRARGVQHHVLGRRFARSRTKKAVGSLLRARALLALFARVGRPDVLLCASRSSAVAARLLGIPSFVVADYEYANVSAYRATGSTFLYPDVIDPQVFLERGLRDHQLIPFAGLKEDVSFAGIDLDAVPAWQPAAANGGVRILYRPPAEESHYYAAESGRLSHALLAHLAGRDGVQVVFAPRYPWQREALDAVAWRTPPVVLDEPVPFVSLLKGVDVVVSSGGTMLREAAYLGIPAYSILQSRIGGVDRYLESIGRVRFIASPAEFGVLELRRSTRLDPLRRNPNLLGELARTVAAAA
jgi:uncharacterized protein